MAFAEHYIPKAVTLFKKEENKITTFVDKLEDKATSRTEETKANLKVEGSVTLDPGSPLSGPPSYLTTTSTP